MSRIAKIVTSVAVTAGTIGTAISRARRRQRRTVLDATQPAAIYETQHAIKVQQIAAQLRAHPDGTPVSLRKNAPPHQVPKFGDLRRYDHKIDVSALTQILSIDPERRICVAESGAMFEDVVATTLRYGLVPIVVPELKTITVGGAVSGCSIESMSFERGGFHDTCLAYEVITSDGEVLTATRDNEHALVFEMMHGSFGTLGVLSKLTFELVPAKPFVKVVYERHATLTSYRASIERHAAMHDVDFIDGIIHAPDDLVLSCGRFVDHAPYANAYDWMKIYYRSTRERHEDYLRTEDYLFRYDRGVTSVHPSSFLGRLFFGKLLGSGTTLALADKLHAFVLERERPTVTLDIFLPMSRVAEFLTWYQGEFGFYPLWCVPYRRVQDYPWLADSFYAGLADDMFLDIAIYGMKQTGEKDCHRLIERKLRDLGGVKTLISHNYYSRDEFWLIWNKVNYDAVKAVTDPRNLFRDLYTKTCRAAMGIAA